MAPGCWRPVVLLPPSLLDRLDDRQLSQVLMHECAQALLRDALVGFCQRVFSAVLWFHPLIQVWRCQYLHCGGAGRKPSHLHQSPQGHHACCLPVTQVWRGMAPDCQMP
jgi:hypothetical protein